VQGSESLTLRSLVVAAVLLAVAAALIQPLRMPILLIVVLGFAVLRWRRSPIADAWAATIPVLATFAWGVTLSPIAEAGPFACESPLSMPAIARLAEAIGGVLLVLILGRVIGASRADVGLHWPSRAVTAASAALVIVVGPLAVLGFRSFATPFFGAFDYAFAMPSLLVPALVFALANGTLEEVVYRGALLGWTTRVVGWWPAAVAQAVVFGAAHNGPGFVVSALPVMVAMGVAGLLAAVVVRRTGSLLPTIAIHVAVDVPLYLFIACRVP
jgi:membrane protease YdiL (CAAX protease family)